MQHARMFCSLTTANRYFRLLHMRTTAFHTLKTVKISVGTKTKLGPSWISFKILSILVPQSDLTVVHLEKTANWILNVLKLSTIGDFCRRGNIS